MPDIPNIDIKSECNDSDQTEYNFSSEDNLSNSEQLMIKIKSIIKDQNQYNQHQEQNNYNHSKINQTT